jgi:hypothetical protein
LEHLVIFLGHHKIGSTSLQDHFARNAFYLAGQGVLYPYVDFEGAAAFGAQSVLASLPQRLPLNVREPHNALAFSMLSDACARKIPAFHKNLPSLTQMHHAIDQQMKLMRPHTLVLVSEVFANFGAEAPGFVAEIAERFPARNVTLYAGFRRIDDYLQAWHGQRLKFGHRLRALRSGGWTDYLSTIHFDYRRILHGWAQGFPEANLVLRTYDEVIRSGGLIRDFLNYTDLPNGSVSNPDRLNQSLHPALHDILRRGIHELPDVQARQLRKHLLRNAPDLGLPDAKDIEMFGPSQRTEIAWRFAEIDRGLGKVVERKRFFEPEVDISQQRMVAEIDARAQALSALCERSSDVDPEVKAFLFNLRAEG